jgi:hypothetical protein
VNVKAIGKAKVAGIEAGKKKSNRKKKVPRAATFSPPVAGAEKAATSRPPRHFAWQAHGNFRSPHGPAPVHVSRKRAG